MNVSRVVITLVAIAFLAVAVTRIFPIRRPQQTIIVPTPTPADTVAPQEGSFNIFLVALEGEAAEGKTFGCGDVLVPVSRQAPEGVDALSAAIIELLEVEGPMVDAGGRELYNSLYQSDLTFKAARVENRTAVIELSGNLILGGVCDNPRVAEQITNTALQFDHIDTVEVFIDGEPLEEALSLQ